MQQKVKSIHPTCGVVRAQHPTVVFVTQSFYVCMTWRRGNPLWLPLNVNEKRFELLFEFKGQP